MSDKKITLPLYKVIDWILGYRDKAQIELEEAMLIAALDKEESLCHIQYESLEDNSVYAKPYIWRIKDWRTYHLKIQLDKAKQAQQRKEWNLLSENTQLLMRSLAKRYDISDPEILRGIAQKLAKAKKQELLEKLDITTKLDMGD